MFDAPAIIKNIPDIAQIYALNEKQADDLDKASESLEESIYIDTMSEENTKKWENILNLKPQDTDTLDDRRVRVKAKVLEKLPYTYRTIKRRIAALCQDGYTFDVNGREVKVKVALKSKRMAAAVDDMLESCLPLDMIFDVSLMYNTHAMLSKFTHEELNRYTHKQLREEVLE